jgi:hypothetical protein
VFSVPECTSWACPTAASAVISKAGCSVNIRRRCWAREPKRFYLFMYVLWMPLGLAVHVGAAGV